MSEPAARECISSQQREKSKENQQKRKSEKPVAISDLVYIFIDVSNVIHEGSRELGIPKGFNLNVDYDRLVTTVRNGRKLDKVYIVGSIPPSFRKRDQCYNCNGFGHHAKKCTSPNYNRGVNDPKGKEHIPKVELGERAKDLGFIVNIFQRNAHNKEKKVDAQLTCDMMNTIRDENPGTLVLVAGDSDYSIPLNEAKKINWEVETWFWSEGMSKDLKIWPHSPLMVHYKSFAYITGSMNNKYTLEISGDIIKSWKWRNEPIMECFCSFGYLCQLHWVDNITAHLYFNTEAQLKCVKSRLSKKYPNMLIKVQRRENRKVSHERNPPRYTNSNHSSTQP